MHQQMHRERGKLLSVYKSDKWITITDKRGGN